MVPGLILCVPALITVGAIGLDHFGWVKSVLGSVLITGVLSYGLSMLLRSGGVVLQERLYNKWGGPPSTRFLRWSDETLSGQKKTLIHRKISKDFNIKILSPEDERIEPKEADRIIGDAFDSIREKVRTTKKTGKLWEVHNIEYGFYRNFLGSWCWGIILCIIGIAVLALFCFVKSEIDIKLLIGIGMDVLYGLILTAYALARGEMNLKHAAEQYVTSAIETYLSL